MKVRLLIKFSILAFAIISITIPTFAKPQSDSNVTLEEINLGLGTGTLLQWYESRPTPPPNLTGSTTFFGAYVTQPVDNDLYIGLGSYRPAENDGDGSYFAKLTGTTLTGIGYFDEQGIHEMLWDGTLLHIAGTDPHDVVTTGNNWDAGNHYTYNPTTSSFTKYRDIDDGLVYAFHTWGLWKDGSTLYAAASSHDGTYPTDCNYGVDCMGQIFSSIDNGATWTKLADLGDYRAYDIIGYDSDLYAIHNDVLTGTLSLSKSTNGGTTWNGISGLTDNVRRTHMVTFNDGSSEVLIATSFDRASIYSINSADLVTTHAFPTGYLLGATYSDRPAYSDYNLMVVVDGFLYVIAEEQSTGDSAIIRTDDLSNWERMVSTSEKLISLSYWPNNSWLVTSTPGTNARLLRVDISGTPTSVMLNEFSATQTQENNVLFITLASVTFGIVGLIIFRRFKVISKE